MNTINNLERYVLDKIGPWRSNKFISKFSERMEAYRKYHLAKQLEYMRVNFLTEHNIPDGGVMFNVIKPAFTQLLADPRKPVDQIMHDARLLLNTSIAYHKLSNIVGVQPINAAVGHTFRLEYKDNPTRLEVVVEAVETRSRLFSTIVPVDAAMDGLVQSSDAYFSSIAEKLSNEIIHDVLTMMMERSTTHTCSVNVEKNYIHTDRWACTELGSASNDIGKTSRRGAGNFAIMSKDTYASLAGMMTDVPDDIDGDIPELTYVGTFGGGIKAYISNSPLFTNYKVLVGYKGGNGEIDTGIITTPYIPVMSTGVIVNPNTSTPSTQFINRTGQVYHPLVEKYYRVVDLKSILAH